MVNIIETVKDLLDKQSQISSLNLPVYKENKVEIKYIESEEVSTIYEDKPPILPFSDSDVHLAAITKYRRLTTLTDKCKEVFEVAFHIKDELIKFRPGDTIGLLPQNAQKEIDFIIQHLGLKSKEQITYELVYEKVNKRSPVPNYVPVKSTLRHVLTHCVDFRGVIKKLFLLALSKYTTETAQQKVLEYLCSKEGSESYNTFILEQKLCILDIFKLFPSCKPPIQILLINLPRLLPRPYSIANSALKEKNIIKICFSVTKINEERMGLATGFLKEQILSDDIENSLKMLSTEPAAPKLVPIYLRKNLNGFLLPDNEKHLLLISAGTGIAPFIGFLEERSALRKQNSSLDMGDIWLFFGSRNESLDFLYKKELETFIQDGTLKTLTTAFSRQENKDIKYVQDAILKEGLKLAKFITEGSAIFVCGNHKTMMTEVRSAIKSCLQMNSMTEDDAEEFIQNMEKTKNYVIDVWS